MDLVAMDLDIETAQRLQKHHIGTFSLIPLELLLVITDLV